MGNVETWKPKGRFVIPVNEIDSESSDDETVPASSKSTKLANTQNTLPPSATSVSLKQQPSGSKVNEFGNRGIQNASRTIGSESLPRKAKTSSKPVKSSGKSIESTSKLTGSDSTLTGNSLSSKGSASQLTGSSLKSARNGTNLKGLENGSKAAGSVSMETNDGFHDTEIHGTSVIAFSYPEQYICLHIWVHMYVCMFLSTYVLCVFIYLCLDVHTYVCSYQRTF